MAGQNPIPRCLNGSGAPSLTIIAKLGKKLIIVHYIFKIVASNISHSQGPGAIKR